MTKNITLAAIAKRSKVSLSTVSLVLRDKPGIPPETRQRVLRAAQTLGYKAKNKPVSRVLAHHRPGLHLQNVGLVIKTEPGVPPQLNPFYSQVMAGVEDTCRKLKINLLFATLPVDGNNVPTEPLPLVSTGQVDGLILAGTVIDGTLTHLLQASALPVVLLDAYSRQNSFDAVLSDNVRGAYQVTSYLIEKGHRAIGLVGSHPNGYPSLEERRRGYLQALREHGIETHYCADSGSLAADITESTTQLLQTHSEVTAIVGCNDHAAVAALRAAQALNRRVPEDLSLVGFDDIELAQHVHPQLTTMHVDKVSMGRLAVQALINRREFPQSEHVTSMLIPRLVERGSVRQLDL